MFVRKLLIQDDLEVALEETLANGRCDITMYLASSVEVDVVRQQISDFVLDKTPEPIEILTFYWGFRLMKLRPTRPLRELYEEAKLAETGHRLDLLPHHKTATERCPKCL